MTLTNTDSNVVRRMKWVKASHGRIPDGYSPVQGGYEDTGQQLYHALAKIEGHWVPGKTGLHLLGGNFPYHHQEVRMVSQGSYCAATGLP